MVAFAEVERLLDEIRVTWRDVQENPEDFAQELRHFFQDLYRAALTIPT